MMRTLLVAGAILPLLAALGAPADAAKAAGPTLRLDYTSAPGAGNPVAAFMYFVPLISPDPVSTETSPGSTQSARVISAQRKNTSAQATFTRCDFEFSGSGWQQNVFDLTNQIRRHEQQLKQGDELRRQLAAIRVEGPGSGYVEVTGALTNGVETVQEVRLCFNARGKASPVSIELCDVRFHNGAFQQVNAIVARVNTLTFRRQPGRPKMEVTVASVNKKGAGQGLWQSLKGSVKGFAANFFIPPVSVDATGHHTMLEFGRALSAGEKTFTFPRARNLKQPSPAS